jgi:hypothetical protein
MAELTVSNRLHNVEGNVRVDIGEVTPAADGWVTTTLHFVRDVDLMGLDSTAAGVNTYRNSQTASTVEDDYGDFFIENTTAVTYQYIARGW